MKALTVNNLACAAALCFAAMLSSCSLDGDYEQFFPQTDLVTIQYAPDSSSWYLLNDGGLKLWPKNAAEVTEKLKNNARALAAFNVLVDEKVQGYDYVVSLMYMGHINVYGVTPVDSAALRHAPSDTLRNVENVWIGSRYLNIDYYCFYNVDTAKHSASLLCDTTAEQRGGNVKLFFRHNSNGDKGTKSRQSIVSFDLESLRSAVQADTISIAFEAEASDGMYRRDFTYKFKSQGTP
ncbi:MAG: NigD-like protein [Prevotellaceae bacterium]|nr:NigD-like protein [Prevotellaceae bacterium]